MLARKAQAVYPTARPSVVMQGGVLSQEDPSINELPDEEQKRLLFLASLFPFHVPYASHASYSTRTSCWPCLPCAQSRERWRAVFHKCGDYTACLDLLATAKAKYPVKVLGFCLMPNHIHLVVQPATDAALIPFMQWWITSHVRRYHRRCHSHGHVWQGRIKCCPIQQDGNLLTVLRYVLRNPVHTELVEPAIPASERPRSRRGTYRVAPVD